MSGVTGALIQETCSDVMLLPSRDGGALRAGTNLGSKESAAGDTGILGGGVGGTDEESLVGPVSEGHMLLGGIIIAGYRCLVVDRQLAMLLRLESVAKLVGRLDAESLNEDEELLNSVSLSLASYSSSKLFRLGFGPQPVIASDDLSGNGGGGRLPLALTASPLAFISIGL